MRRLRRSKTAYGKPLEADVAKRTARVVGPIERKLASIDRRITDEERELERDRAEKSRAAGYSAIDVGASVLGTILGGGKRSVGTGVRSGARAYGRIRRADEDIKESEEKIAAWTRERDALRAERESELSAARAQAVRVGRGPGDDPPAGQPVRRPRRRVVCALELTPWRVFRMARME